MDIIIEYKDKKNSSATLRNGTLILRISSRISKANQQLHIASLTKRFQHHQEQHKAAPLIHNESYNFYGLKTLTLKIEESASSRTSIKIDAHQLIIKKAHSQTDSDLRAKIAKKITNHLENDLIHYVYAISEATLNHDPEDVYFKNLKSRWGHCHYHYESITLSTKLAWVPKSHFNYVIIHELCHLIHPNHSAKYWQLVKTYCPNYLKLRKELVKWQ
ncbi:hypothetical protein COV81_02150 [Candidatus Peregrinibacteria bacterium CG11_big_fil_rev_8_21_14_0_20_41_10]|nr:MAG: hypothetical protein COV81_02150 [Candidatus Peregrinibacteria bacterium CG11_big_fil_rev_8_21_14_0_20_41_10]PIZ73371.1 MAG: hypothetical protein COY06_05415 [Candidatus Peregrinibacteria bacterium CG_4_10_14_0_2_um_filter_41_8]PJC37633.1 MAG: hypothetical protein CO045_04590 [Candidatus Peregrinibacteria bacterium CG_4_9_14_0_2_um_filter_41_14]